MTEAARADQSSATGGGLDVGDASANGDRLARSRERLRRVLSGAQPATAVAETTPLPSPQHPALRVAQVAARGTLEALAERHPFRLVGVAFAAGGLLLWTRPWRVLLRPALIAGVAAHLIARAPAGNALELLTTILSRNP